MATPEQIERAKRLLRIRRAEERLARLRGQVAPAPQATGLPAGEAFRQGMGNLPADAAELAKGMATPITDPGAYAHGVRDMIGGTVSLLPGTQSAEHEGYWGRAAEAIKERYGGWENIKRSFAESPAHTLMDMLSVGAPMAGVAGKAMGAATRVPDTREFVEGAPTTEALKDAGSALYEGLRTKSAAAIGSGAKGAVTVPAQAYQGFAHKLAKRMSAEGLDPVLHPTAARVIELARLPAQTSAVKLPLMMNLRRHFGQASRSAEPSEARLGQIATDMLDDFMEKEVSGTHAQLQAARGTWAKMRKSELIDETIERALSRAAGPEAGLRNEFAALWRNNKKMRGFSAAEKKAIFAVADGNLTANALRRIGSIGGGQGQGRNVLNALIASGTAAAAGGAAAGPVGAAIAAVGIPVAGHLAGRAATRATRGRADLARAIVARGETPAQVAEPRPFVQGVGRGLAAAPPEVAALMGAGWQGARGGMEEARLRALRGY